MNIELYVDSLEAVWRNYRNAAYTFAAVGAFLGLGVGLLF